LPPVNAALPSLVDRGIARWQQRASGITTMGIVETSFISVGPL